jgi:26S proteasome regulatory subunit N1
MAQKGVKKVMSSFCMSQVTKTLKERISTYGQIVLQTLAYAGTGDVLQIQSLLATCGEHIEVDENAAWKVSCAI